MSTTTIPGLENLMTIEQVSSELDISTKTLRDWAAKGKFPAPLKIGRRCTRWRREDVELHKRQQVQG